MAYSTIERDHILAFWEISVPKDYRTHKYVYPRGKKISNWELKANLQMWNVFLTRKMKNIRNVHTSLEIFLKKTSSYWLKKFMRLVKNPSVEQ
jgi:hypothetical protein